MKKFLLLFIILLQINCTGENETSESPVENSTEEQHTTIEINAETKVNLMPEAEQELVKWPAFVNIRGVIQQMENFSYNELAANAEPLSIMAFELQNTLPSNYRVPSVESRIKVVYTRALILNQKINSSSTKTHEISTAASNLLSEFEYLKIQLNELFLLSPSEFEIDLEEIKANYDSLPPKEETVSPPVLQTPSDAPSREAGMIIENVPQQ